MIDTLRQQRVGIVAWVIGGTAAMFFMGLSLAKEMADFPGGASALASAVMPAAEALRLLRWPAEHLETLGGYMTYHNIILFQGFLALYGAIQGARTTRGSEEHLFMEEVLATGWSRSAVLRDRALGFLGVIAVIWIGLSAGVAASLIAADEPNTLGSVVSMGSVALCTFAAYALGVLVSQFTRTARAAAGLSSLLLVVCYVITNMADKLGPFDWVQFLSPFTWANRSRALVPGYGLDVTAMLVLILAAAACLLLAMAAFEGRDYAGVAWAPSRAGAHVRRQRRLDAWWLRHWWTAHLVHHRWGLVAWTIATSAFVAVMMAMQPSVLEAWLAFDFWATVMGGMGKITPEAMYTSFIVDILAPVVVAYVISQAAGWVADLQEGRVEMLLSAPLTWPRLILERLVAVIFGAAVITIASALAVIAGSLAVGAPIDAAGLLRSLTITWLLAAAIGGLALTCVALMRNRVAVTLLAVYAGAAYLLTWMIPIFEWPTWVYRLTIFDAFGHPYQEWPTTAGLTVLLAFAVLGTALAVVLAARSPKVAGAR